MMQNELTPSRSLNENAGEKEERKTQSVIQLIRCVKRNYGDKKQGEGIKDLAVSA